MVSSIVTRNLTIVEQKKRISELEAELKRLHENYKSAVKGRQDFRRALGEERKRIVLYEQKWRPVLKELAKQGSRAQQSMVLELLDEIPESKK